MATTDVWPTFLHILYAVNIFISSNNICLYKQRWLDFSKIVIIILHIYISRSENPESYDES